MNRIVLAAGLAAMLAAPLAGAYAMSSSSSADVSIGDVKREVDKENYDDAIMKAEMYLKDNPRSADAYNYIGYSHRQQGDYEAARKAYDRALQIDPYHVGVHEYYGELHIKLGDLAKAETHLAELSRICGTCLEQRTLNEKIAQARAGG